jgi:hypothetical protein
MVIVTSLNYPTDPEVEHKLEFRRFVRIQKRVPTLDGLTLDSATPKENRMNWMYRTRTVVWHVRLACYRSVSLL